MHASQLVFAGQKCKQKQTAAEFVHSQISPRFKPRLMKRLKNFRRRLLCFKFTQSVFLLKVEEKFFMGREWSSHGSRISLSIDQLRSIYRLSKCLFINLLFGNSAFLLPLYTWKQQRSKTELRSSKAI